MFKWTLISVVIFCFLAMAYYEFFEREDPIRFEIDTGERHYGYELGDTRAAYDLSLQEAQVFALREARQPSLPEPKLLSELHSYPDDDRVWSLRIADGVDTAALQQAAHLLERPIEQLTAVEVNVNQLRTRLKYQLVPIDLPIGLEKKKLLVTAVVREPDYREFRASVEGSGNQYYVVLKLGRHELTGRIVAPDGEFQLATVNHLTVMFPVHQSLKLD